MNLSPELLLAFSAGLTLRPLIALTRYLGQCAGSLVRCLHTRAARRNWLDCRRFELSNALWELGCFGRCVRYRLRSWTWPYVPSSELEHRAVEITEHYDLEDMTQQGSYFPETRTFYSRVERFLIVDEDKQGRIGIDFCDDLTQLAPVLCERYVWGKRHVVSIHDLQSPDYQERLRVASWTQLTPEDR